MMYREMRVRYNATNALITFFGLVFLMDEALLPVFHFGGIPFKVSYLLSALWLSCYIFRINIFGSIPFLLRRGSGVARVVFGFWALVVISLISEFTMMFFTRHTNAQPFFDGILYYLYIISAIGLGYSLWKMNPKVFIWVLYGYCLLNIAMLLFYSALPSSIRGLYGEYYASGIRIRGTGGNANTTLLVMNTLFMAVILMVHRCKMKLKGIHVFLVMMLPMLTNFFISSRGEFLHTVALECVLLSLVVKKDPNKLRVAWRVIIIAILLLIAYQLIFVYLYHSNENVRYGIDRLGTITEFFEVQADSPGVEEADNVFRPLFRADVFWARFKHSPIWGAGYSYGEAADFVKSVDGYHNDWFRILASVGIIGFCIWITNIKKLLSATGIYILLPFLLAGLSNTFLQSTHALNIYFFAMGTVLHWQQEDH